MQLNKNYSSLFVMTSFAGQVHIVATITSALLIATYGLLQYSFVAFFHGGLSLALITLYNEHEYFFIHFLASLSLFFTGIGWLLSKKSFYCTYASLFCCVMYYALLPLQWLSKTPTYWRKIRSLFQWLAIGFVICSLLT